MNQITTTRKVLSWIPLVGALVETYCMFSGKGSYLSEPRFPHPYLTSLLYHGALGALIIAPFLPQ